MPLKPSIATDVRYAPGCFLVPPSRRPSWQLHIQQGFSTASRPSQAASTRLLHVFLQQSVRSQSVVDKASKIVVHYGTPLLALNRMVWEAY